MGRVAGQRKAGEFPCSGIPPAKKKFPRQCRLAWKRSNLYLKKGGLLTVAIRLPLQTEACRRLQPNIERPVNAYKVWRFLAKANTAGKAGVDLEAEV